MPTKLQSGKRSSTSSARSDKPKLSPLARDIVRGLREAAAHMRGEVTLNATRVRVPDTVDVKEIRASLGLSQAEFARRYGFSSRSLQEWEQGRRRPEGAVRAYLLVIGRNPRAVEQALAS